VKLPEDPSAEFAARVFLRHGLGSPRFWRTSGIPAEEGHPDAAAIGLCKALAQLGGIYGAFARFLRWRADLLRDPYTSHLRHLSVNPPAVPAASVATLLRQEFGALAEEPASALSRPLWNTPFRSAYLSTYRYQPVIVEVAQKKITEESFEEFEKSLRSLGHPELAAIVEPSVLLQFREYVRNGESLVRERSFLDVLGEYRGDTVAEYPLPIPELCSPNVLCWPADDGRAVSDLIERGDDKAPALIAAAIFEQLFSLSMVDADLDLDAMSVDEDNRLHFRRLNNPIAVLPGVIDTGIKYVTSVVAGNAPRCAQTLIRLMISRPPLDLEKQLMKEFSSVEPELKIKMWFPSSAEAFENSWRALAKIVPSRPLFLDCLHRNLLAAGYWNSDAVTAGAPAVDAVAEGLRPAVVRLLRNQSQALFNRESLQEWAVGSGMLMLGTFREMNRQVEELRENDLTVGVDRGEWRSPAGRGERSAGQVVILGCLIAFLLAFLQWGHAVSATWSLLLKILAAGTLPAMFWALSKIR
jgi:hypothetical protein